MVSVIAIEQGIDLFEQTFNVENSTTGIIISIGKQYIYMLVPYSEVRDAPILKVKFFVGTSVEASVHNYDVDYDMAILTVSIGSVSEEILSLIKYVVPDGSSEPTTGTPVMAVGSPTGRQDSILYGMISRKTSKNVFDGRIDIYQTDMFYHDNSNGLILNMQGDFIGIMTHVLIEEEDDRITTFVGINMIKPIIEKLINQSKFTLFGVITEDIPHETLLLMDVESGIFIYDVKTGSPAFEAGIQKGDIITHVNDVKVHSVTAFLNMVNSYKSGTTVMLKLKRVTTKQEYKDVEAFVTLRDKE